MFNLIQFIVKNGAFFLLIVLQSLCFWMIVTFNDTHRGIYLHTSTMITGGIQEEISNFYDYWRLYQISDSLAADNARLLQKTLFADQPIQRADSLTFGSDEMYELIPAKVIYNSVTKRNNNLLINKGKKDGIREGMGVIDRNEGVIGITKHCSQNYCRVLSVLHSQSMISAKILHRDYFGSAVWRTANPTELLLEAIPVHATFDSGDTVITSGYSTLFPEGIPLGVIVESELPQGSNFFKINVKMINDLSKAKYVFVVNDPNRAEKSELIKGIQDE